MAEMMVELLNGKSGNSDASNTIRENISLCTDSSMPLHKELNKVFLNTRREVLEMLDNQAPPHRSAPIQQTNTESPSHESKLNTPINLIGNYKKSGLKPVNFTNGEVCFEDFCRVLEMTMTHIGGTMDGFKFVDLGCGAGSCLASALLLSQYVCI